MPGPPPGRRAGRSARHDLGPRAERPDPVGGRGARSAYAGPGRRAGPAAAATRRSASRSGQVRRRGGRAHAASLPWPSPGRPAASGTAGDRAADAAAGGRFLARAAVARLGQARAISSRIAGGNPCMRVVLRTLDTAPSRTASARRGPAGHRGRRPSVPTARWGPDAPGVRAGDTRLPATTEATRSDGWRAPRAPT